MWGWGEKSDVRFRRAACIRPEVARRSLCRLGAFDMRAVGLAGIALAGLVTGCAGPQTAYNSYPAPAYSPPHTVVPSDVILPSGNAASRADPVRELSDAIQVQRFAYYRCVKLAALQYIEAAENAATVTNAAMTRCHKEEAALQSAVAVHNRTAVPDHRIQDIHRESTRSYMIEMVIRVREAARQLDRYKSRWSECVVTAATVHAANGPKAAIAASLSDCSSEEMGMKAAWAAMIDDTYAAEKMSETKRRAVPILAKYVEALNGAGRDTVRKPDMTI